MTLMLYFNKLFKCISREMFRTWHVFGRNLACSPFFKKKFFGYMNGQSTRKLVKNCPIIYTLQHKIPAQYICERKRCRLFLEFI